VFLPLIAFTERERERERDRERQRERERHLTDNSANSICSGNETETAELKLLGKDTTLTISLLSPSVSSFSKLSIAPYFLHVNTSNNKKICSLLFTTKPRINNVVVDDISNA